MRKILAFFILFFFSLSAIGVDSPSTQSIKWQKYKIENDLKLKIKNLVGQVVDQSKFFVEVEVVAKEVNIPVPEYNLVQEKRPSLSDRKGLKLSGDYILFDKIGLNAPLYDGGKALRESDLQLKIFQYSKRVEREYINKNDLFNNVEALKIKLGFDLSVGADAIKSAKDMITTMLPNFAGVKPSVEHFSFKFKAQDVKQIGFLEKWSGLLTPVGIIVATLLFCLTIFMVFKGIQKDKKNLENKRNDQEKQAKELSDEADLPSLDNKIDPNLRPGSPQLAQAIEEKSDGVERFILFAEKSQEQAIKLVKKWISLDTKVTRQTISLLGERLSVDELYRILIKLDVSERNHFQKMSQIELNAQDKIESNRYLSQQVLEDIFMVNIIEDKELLNLLVKVTPKMASEIIVDHPGEGTYLVNLLSSEFVSEVFKFLSPEVMKEVTKGAIHLEENDFEREYTALKTILKSYTKETYVNPFLNRVAEWALNLDGTAYQNLIETLFETNEIGVVEELVRNRLPGVFIEKLSGENLKLIFKAAPLKLRVQYLSLLEENKRFEVLDKVSVFGSKNRDVLDFELNKLIEDDFAFAEVKNSKILIEESLLEIIKNLRESDLKFAKSIDVAIEVWIEEQTNKESSLDAAA